MSARPEYFRMENINGGELTLRLQTSVDNGSGGFIESTDWNSYKKTGGILKKKQTVQLINVLQDFLTMCKKPGEPPDDMQEE